MDKKSKIFFLVFFLFLAGSVFATYYRVVIARDYVIMGQTDCDPTTENCFIYECDPEAGECTGIPEEDTWYYKKVSRKAANIPLCDPNDENCEALVCGEGEEECEEILCSEETMAEGDICSDPETYNAENPVEEECKEPSGAEAGGDEECLTEEESECEEGDEECLAGESEDASVEEAACEEGDEACEADEMDNPNLSTKEAGGIGSDMESGESEEKENPAAVDTGDDSVQRGGFPLE